MFGSYGHVESTILAGAASYPLYRLARWLFFLSTGAEFPLGWARFALFLGIFVALYIIARILISRE
ncbi:MAG: hypothetical protein AB1641_24700 [Thermodesulfobacteriota bacterium]